MIRRFNQDGLPINLDDLIHLRTVEETRVEFKATWDMNIRSAVNRTICAFANDLLNMNGGYIVLGIEEKDGQPILPPRGLAEGTVDQIQKEISGDCKGMISPTYLPLIFPLVFQDKMIIVIWAPAGDNRPYEAPGRKGENKTYYVRSGPCTVEATGDLRRQLFEQAAKIPFDDRRSLNGRVEDISVSLVKKFLTDIGSGMASMDFDALDLYRKLRIILPINSHEVPRNVALLFFNESPESFFQGAFIEVVQFGGDAGGDKIEEKKFLGSLPDQIRSCLNYLNGFGGVLLQKVPGQAATERTLPYPYEAMREAIVNAVYHRSYEAPPEPVKIYLYPDRMEITSYPGPVSGITQEQIQSGRTPSVPARNRRIGDLLKDLGLAEGRGTGIPKLQRRMHENGSPEAVFDFDEARTYFRVMLPVHPRYQALHAMREAAQFWAVGEKEKALSFLQKIVEQQPGNGVLVSQMVEYALATDKEGLAKQVVDHFEKQSIQTETSQPYLAIARGLMNRSKLEEAKDYLRKMPSQQTLDEMVETAILKKKAKDWEGAHRIFALAYTLAQNDPKIIHEFAQTKMKLARAYSEMSRSNKVVKGVLRRDIKQRLEKEAVELLRKAIQLTDDNTRKAWCWFDLAKVLHWLKNSHTEIEEAYLNAQRLLPDESRFSQDYTAWKNRGGHKATRG